MLIQTAVALLAQGALLSVETPLSLAMIPIESAVALTQTDLAEALALTPVHLNAIQPVSLTIGQR